MAKTTVSKDRELARLENLIDEVSADRGNVTYAVNRKFRRRHMAEDFTLSYDRPLSPQACEPAILSIPFLANVLPVIWASGERYRIRAIDKDFWDGMRAIKDFYIRGFFRLDWSGEVVPDDVVETPASQDWDSEAPRGILYSGGTDSTFTALSEGRAGDMMINIQGAGVLLKHPNRARMLREAVNSFADAMGFHASYVSSNLNGFLKYHYFPGGDWWSEAQYGLGIPSLGIPLAVSEGQSGLFIAGHVHTDPPRIGGEHPEIGGNIRFAGRRVLHHGSEFSRAEKVAAIIHDTKAGGDFKPKIQVCFADQDEVYNCGRCLKCMVRALAFIIEDGAPEDYGFDQNATEIMRFVRPYIVDATRADPVGAAAFRAVQEAAAARRTEDPNWPQDPEQVEFFDWLSEFDLEGAVSAGQAGTPLRQRVKHVLRRRQGLTRWIMAVDGMLRGGRP